MIKYYPFELHTHTIHSDGGMRPAELADKAKERGLSGFALTDHNTTSAIPEAAARAGEKGVILIKGEEWTTFYGHLTVLGGNSRVKWTDITYDNINEIIKKARESGDIVNAAHPKRMGSPVCTGCYMDYPLDFNLITGYEVWSNDKPQFNGTNKTAYAEYRELLAKGYKLSCIYGNDWHNPKENSKLYAITHIGAEGALTSETAIEGIKKGRTYISTGITAEIELIGNDRVNGLGDTVPPGGYKLKVKVSKDEEFCSRFGISPERIIVRGTAGESEIELKGKEAIAELSLKAGYIMIEVKGEIDSRKAELLITSPIYVKEDGKC